MKFDKYLYLCPKFSFSDIGFLSKNKIKNCTNLYNETVMITLTPMLSIFIIVISRIYEIKR